MKKQILKPFDVVVHCNSVPFIKGDNPSYVDTVKSVIDDGAAVQLHHCRNTYRSDMVVKIGKVKITK